MVLDGTGSVKGGTGWYLMVLGHYVVVVVVVVIVVVVVVVVVVIFDTHTLKIDGDAVS